MREELKTIRLLKWLYPGMRVKRWILLCALGIIMVTIGSVVSLYKTNPIIRLNGILTLILGIGLVVFSLKRMVKSFISLFLPQREKELVNIVYQKRHLERGPKIVVIGGGRGLSVLLHGLKEHTSNITAIVTVADDGGSSGRLRDEFDVLPPGDIRDCLVALADAPTLMRQLFQFRFDEKSQLHGHNFGNLFITAMSKVAGDFEKAIKESSKVLAIRGRVIPSTLRKVVLVAEHKDGSQTTGETSISKSQIPIKRISLKPNGCQPTEEALRAIEEADAIILGPGSLYTSVIPNLLVNGISNAISKSKALKIYVCNVMSQAGETDGYSAFDHINTIIAHTQPTIIEYCIVNVGRVPKDLQEKYKKEGSFPVVADSHRIRQEGYSVIEDDCISTTDFVTHDPERLTKILIRLIQDAKSRR